MAAPVAAAAVKKAAGNPTASVFLAVLVGAVVLQGLKTIPDLGKFFWNKLPILPDIDVTAPIDYTSKAITTTAALNEEVYEGIDQISAKEQDPFESFIFGDEDFNVYEPGEVPTLRRIYQSGRNSLFTGLINRGGNY